MRKYRDDIPGGDPEILNALDELNLEETELLLSGIEKVSLSADEESSLRGKLRERGRAEGLEPEEEGERKAETGKGAARGEGRPAGKSRIPMRRAVACAAAVLICSIAVIAAANMDGLQRYWGDEGEIYRNSDRETVQSVENEHVKANIEGIVADNYQCVFIFSVEALTEEGRKIIKQNVSRHMSLEMEIRRPLKAGAENPGAWGIFQYTDDNRNQDYKAYECSFELENLDLTQPVTVEFAGLEMSFDVPQSLQVITLYPDSESEIERADLSPIGCYYKGETLEDEFKEFRLIRKDGTLEDEMGYFGSLSQDDNGEVTATASFSRLIDLDDYQGIQIDGISYTIK